MSIKQAIEALEELIEYAETAGFDWSLDNARAALAALRSMPQGEPVDDAMNTLCKMMHSGEEVESDDGLAMLVPMDLWNEAQEAIELLVGEDDATEAKPAQDAVDAEPKSLNAKIADQLRPFLKPGDKVIWREAFRWHDDNGVMPNHYDGMSIAGLADEFGYRFDWDFNMNHAAIIQGAALNASKEQP